MSMIYDKRVRLRGMERDDKVGFVHEGRMRQAAYKHGSYSAVLYMSVLREEWDALTKES